MPRYWKISLLFVLGFILLAVVALWAGFDRLTADVLRPWIAAKVGDALSGRAELGTLEIHGGRIQLLDLTIEKPDEFRLYIPEITLGFTWPGLLSRRLDKVAIIAPEMVWNRNSKDIGESPKPAPGSMDQAVVPDRPPVAVGDLTLTRGRATLMAGAHRVAVREIELLAQIGPQLNLELALSVGDDAGIPMALKGHGTWEGSPALTLTDLTWADQHLLLKPVTLTPGLGGFGTTLGLDRIDDGQTARILAAIGQTPPWPDEVHWDISSPVVSVRIGKDELSGTVESGAGKVTWGEGEIYWDGARFLGDYSGDQWRAEGRIRFPADALAQCSGTFMAGSFGGSCGVAIPRPGDLAASFGESLPAPMAELADFQLSGSFAGKGDAWTFKSEALRVSLGEHGLLDGSVSFEVNTGSAVAELMNLRLHEAGKKGVLLDGTLKMMGDMAKGRWTGDWRFMAPSIGEILRLAEKEIPQTAGDIRDLKIEGRLAVGGKGISLPGIRMQGRLAGPELAGDLSARLAVRLEEEWQVDVTEGKIGQFEYFSTDGTLGVGGGQLEIGGEVRSSGNRIGFTLEGEARAKEAMVGSWYGALDDLPVDFHLDGGWDGKPAGMEITRSDFDFAGLASARLTGKIGSIVCEGSGKVVLPRLGGRFLEALRRLSRDIFPAADLLELEGSLAADGTIRMEDKGWNADLNLVPDRIAFQWGEDLAISGLTGRLPVRLGTGEGVPSGPEEPGRLDWSVVSTKLVDSGPGGLEVSLGRNRVRLLSPVSLPVAGGKAMLKSFHAGWTDAGLDLGGSVSVEKIDLEQISGAFGWPTMAGALSAELEDIRYANDEIETGGEATLKVFDGSFLVRNLRVRKPFSSYPTYHADIDFSGLDLQLLTHTFEFGEINGVADGFVHDLRLFDGVPSAFKAKFETRTTGTRNISVKAIKNLNTLSQGGMSAALTQGIYQFIDFYRYRKIGIECRLANDLFHLEGTARKGSDKYLIYGSLLPPRIDVIVSTSTISFKEMVKRLQRIERTGG